MIAQWGLYVKKFPANCLSPRSEVSVLCAHVAVASHGQWADGGPESLGIAQRTARPLALVQVWNGPGPVGETLNAQACLRAPLFIGFWLCHNFAFTNTKRTGAERGYNYSLGRARRNRKPPGSLAAELGEGCDPPMSSGACASSTPGSRCWCSEALIHQSECEAGVNLKYIGASCRGAAMYRGTNL